MNVEVIPSLTPDSRLVGMLSGYAVAVYLHTLAHVRAVMYTHITPETDPDI